MGKRLALAIAFFTTMALLRCCTDVAVAQECSEVSRPDPDYVVLARLCVHEAGWGRQVRHGWELPVADCAAINAVIERVQSAMSRSRGYSVPFAAAVARYSDSIFDRARTDQSCYVPWLDASGLEPRCWSGSVPWENRRDAWARWLAVAEQIRAGTLSHRCVAPPHHWGCGTAQIERGCQDHERAMRLGMEQIECGATANRFYRSRRLARFDVQ